MAVFATSDLHLFHANIIKYCNRPFSSMEEMNDTIIRNWNKTVTPNDKVYVLGDFALPRGEDRESKVQKLNNVCSRLNGMKILVYGNHDLFEPDEYLQAGFTYVNRGYIDVNECGSFFVMSHYQMTSWNRSHFGSFHLFGHEHWKRQWEPKHSIFSEMHWSERKFNVCVDANDFAPVDLHKIIETLSKRETNFKNGNDHRAENNI